MKLLVFAHTPPPHHGQSYMVQLMLDGFGGDWRRRRRAAVSPGPESAAMKNDIQCYHINARLSKNLNDIGDLRLGKLFLLVGYCLQAIWCRYRYGVTDFYYIPAPGKRSALFRDWVVMALCRPVFKRVILHWHASGLAKWLETSVQNRTRSITYNFLGQADLSIVLSNYGRSDANKLLPRQIAVVGNGVPDPCPDFAEKVLPRRRARLQARKALIAGGEWDPSRVTEVGSDPHILKVLFLGHCTEDKGLFDAVQGAILVHQRLKSSGSRIVLKLFVAGEFVNPAEEAAFREICETSGQGVVEHVGFVSGARKQELLESMDVFCFPSYLESFGLVLVEAMAFGLPIVTTRCGAIPEVMPPGYPGLVSLRAPQQVADAILAIMDQDVFEAARQRFKTRFAVDQHVFKLAEAIRSTLAPNAPRGPGVSPG